MKLTKSNYTLIYDPLDQQVDFEGTLRLSSEEDVNEIFQYLVQAHDQVQGSLSLNFRRLRYINAMGLKALTQFVAYARGRNSLRVKIVASGVLAWGERILPNLTAVWPQVEFSVYDRNFYRSQNLIEDLDFIPLLRNQTRILWPLEKEILRKHGLGRGMKVADICCGCGDVPLLICREFQPSFVLGVDHSEASIEYARNLQDEFAVKNAEFQRGDATALMIANDSYDFVICRLSLQIFSQPELILSELIRIAKPGGRVYVICEDYDLIVGNPENETIRNTYQLAAEYGDEMGMDLRQGKKLFTMLSTARMEDIKVDPILVDTNNTPREAFARVIDSWQHFSVYSIGNNLGLSDTKQAELLAGYQAQLRAIHDQRGYTTWGMVAVSGRKPAAE